MDRRNYYKDLPSLDEALSMWAGRFPSGPVGTETVRSHDSVGRVTASAVFAAVSSPMFHSSAMDGYAVKASDTFAASDREPLRLRLDEQAFMVDTGDPLPEGTDSVIMIEDTDSPGDGVIEITAPASPWKNVRPMGEDIVKSELILPRGHTVRPMDAAAVLSAGVTEVDVVKRPAVTIIPSGDEIVPPGGPYKTGDIIEFNSAMLKGMAEAWGASVTVADIVPDDPDALRDALDRALEASDVVVINAGSSAGSEDYTHDTIAALGEVYTDGVNLKPAKPVILGMARGKPVLGIPGFPVAAELAFRLFAAPVIHAMQGVAPPACDRVTATLGRQLSSSLGVTEFVRVKVGRVGGKLVATPLPRGSGKLMSLVRSDGSVRIPPEMEGLAAGSEAEIELARPLSEIEGTVVCIGSHDNALDLLADYLRHADPRFGLSSAHVGSLGGLMALKRGEAHMAGTHLLDEETGEYNVSYIRKHLEGTPVTLVNLAYRKQGLMVRPGNPKGISGIGDLPSDGIRFVNRQRGAGTRILLDLELKKLGISPERIEGYDDEEYTHMGVAVAVASGRADAGLGILAAAGALGLDFIPVADERYDLAIPTANLEIESVSALLGILKDDLEFRQAVESLGGYDTGDMGRVVHETM